MNKSIFVIYLLFIFSGCATDNIYNKAKTIYIKERKVVIKNWDELPDDVKRKLQEIDFVAKKYNRIRTTIKEFLQKKKKDVTSQKKD